MKQKNIKILLIVNLYQNLYLIKLNSQLYLLFDIYKIYPVNKAEEIQGSIGVILDDIVAGIYTLVIVMSYKITFILI